MEPEVARAYLRQIKGVLIDRNKELEKEGKEPAFKCWLEALDVALDTIKPPLGAGHCEWIFLPDKDMTPLAHMKPLRELLDEFDSVKPWPARKDPRRTGEITISGEKVEITSMALSIYKSVLMAVNRDEMREKMREEIAKREAEEQKAGKKKRGKKE